MPTQRATRPGCVGVSTLPDAEMHIHQSTHVTIPACRPSARARYTPNGQLADRLRVSTLPDDELHVQWSTRGALQRAERRIHWPTRVGIPACQPSARARCALNGQLARLRRRVDSSRRSVARSAVDSHGEACRRRSQKSPDGRRSSMHPAQCCRDLVRVRSAEVLDLPPSDREDRRRQLRTKSPRQHLVGLERVDRLLQ